MTHEEIKATWDELIPDEAFEAFEHEDVDNADIGEVLGQDVASEYSHWIYANLK